VIDWIAFLSVFGASLLATAVVVSLFSLGIRLLGVAGKIPIVEPAAFTDQITVIDPDQAKAARKAVKKAKKHNPLSDTQKRTAEVSAWICFGLTGVAVLYGIYLIVPALHALG
jgi:hypothetical protein